MIIKKKIFDVKLITTYFLLAIAFLFTNTVYAKDKGEVVFIGEDVTAVSELQNKLLEIMCIPNPKYPTIGKACAQSGNLVTLSFEKIVGNLVSSQRLYYRTGLDLVVIVVNLQSSKCFANFSGWLSYAEKNTITRDYVVVGVNCNTNQPECELARINEAISEYNCEQDTMESILFRKPPEWYKEGKKEKEERMRRAEEYCTKNASQKVKFFDGFRFVVNAQESYNVLPFLKFLVSRVDIIPEKENGFNEFSGCPSGFIYCSVM